MTLPRVQPIVPTRRKESFDDPEWLFDFKYDGFPALCALVGAIVKDPLYCVFRPFDHVRPFDPERAKAQHPGDRHSGQQAKY